MSVYKGKYFSVLGDSISTFYGKVPKTFYGIGNLAERGSGVNSPDDTWWMQVINCLGAKLLTNNSYSGSMVADADGCENTPSACSKMRTAKLHENGVNPDVVMVYMGTNDAGNRIAIDGEEGDTYRFKSAYKVMLERIKGNYPNAEIWCFTLCRPEGGGFDYMGEYSEAIRRCARALNCKVIELYNQPRRYSTCDGLHPDADGMKTIADIVLRQVVKVSGTESGKIYVTGDTHGTDLLAIHLFCDSHPELTKDDYIIIAGDFGAIWFEDTLKEDLKRFSDLPVTVLFVDGNHENFDLLNAYPVETWNGGKIHRIKPDIIHLMRGQVFEIAGKTIFTFGGATSIDREYRKEGQSWWPQELPTFDEFDEGLENLKRYGNRVDYIITHSCGYRALAYPKLRLAAGKKLTCPESQMLSDFEDIVEFKHWYFGHFHIDEELGDKFTVLYNRVVEIE